MNGLIIGLGNVAESVSLRPWSTCWAGLCFFVSFLIHWPWLFLPPMLTFPGLLDNPNSPLPSSTSSKRQPISIKRSCNNGIKVCVLVRLARRGVVVD